ADRRSSPALTPPPSPISRDGRKCSRFRPTREWGRRGSATYVLAVLAQALIRRFAPPSPAGGRRKAPPLPLALLDSPIAVRARNRQARALPPPFVAFVGAGTHRNRTGCGPARTRMFEYGSLPGLDPGIA